MDPRTSEAFLAPVSPSGCRKRDASGRASGLTPLNNLSALEVRNLRKHSENDLSYPLRNHTESVHMDRHAGSKQLSDGRLNVECITPEAIYCIDEDRITPSHGSEQLRKTWPLCRHNKTTDAEIGELGIKPAT